MGLKNKDSQLRGLPSVVKRIITGFLSLLLFVTSINLSVFAKSDETFNEVNYENITQEYLNENTNPSEIPISFEDVSKRDAFTKHFRKLDGSYEVSVYDEVIHYFNDNEWKSIDNRLTLDEQTNEYENKENSFKFKLPKKIHDNKSFKLSFEKYQIDWTINNINHTDVTVIENEVSNRNNLRLIENVKQRVIYEDIQNNVNLEYILTGNQIKENMDRLQLTRQIF